MRDPVASPDFDFLTPAEVAMALHVSKRHVQDLLALGRIPGARDMGLGQKHYWRIHRPTFEAAMETGHAPTQLRAVKGRVA